jgi:hypothetical protein
MNDFSKSNKQSQGTAHKYTDEERQAIIDNAPGRLTDADWEQLERLGNEFADEFRAKFPKLNKDQTKSIKQLSLRLRSELRACSADLTLSETVKRLTELEPWADAHFEPRKGRANPALDAYYFKIIVLYIKYGGYPGKDDESPCVRFVEAVVNPVVVALGCEPKSVAHNIRKLVWLMPAFMINTNNFFPVAIHAEPQAGMGCN